MTMADLKQGTELIKCGKKNNKVIKHGNKLSHLTYTFAWMFPQASKAQIICSVFFFILYTIQWLDTSCKIINYTHTNINTHMDFNLTVLQNS